MLGNAVKQTTATTGTGALTLSTSAGSPAFSDAFVLNQLFAYSLLDSSGLLIETGLGYLSSTTVLVRAKISSTLVAGAYNKSNPTAATLAGTTTIIATPTASTLPSVLPTVDGQIAGLNRWVTSAGRTMGQSPQALSALTVYYLPIQIRTGAPVVSLSINVITAIAASVARAGIYSVNEKGYIGALLATTGDLDSTTTGIKTGTVTQLALPPGDYWQAVVSSGGITVTSYTTNLTYILGGGPCGFSGINVVEFRTETAATAVLPVTPSLTTSGTNVAAFHPPCVFIGVA